MLVNIPAPWTISDRDNPRKRFYGGEWWKNGGRMVEEWWKNGGRMDMVRGEETVSKVKSHGLTL